MCIHKRFNEVFGLEDRIEEEKERFINRVNQIIFHRIDTEQVEQLDYSLLYELVCFELGVNAHDFGKRELGVGYILIVPAAIRTVTGDSFEKTLIVLCALYKYLSKESHRDVNSKWLSKQINSILNRCTLEIGVRWKDGFFYPSGAEELDKPLVEETMTWLKDYPNESQNIRTALQCYMAGDSLTDVITNCYSAVEGIARKVLGNQKTLDNNKNDLLAKIDLSDGWKAILANYISYSHDYRHASEERHDITKHEAEAYLYMTGLIIRLTIESK